MKREDLTQQAKDYINDKLGYRTIKLLNKDTKKAKELKETFLKRRGDNKYCSIYHVYNRYSQLKEKYFIQCLNFACGLNSDDYCIISFNKNEFTFGLNVQRHLIIITKNYVYIIKDCLNY